MSDSDRNKAVLEPLQFDPQFLEEGESFTIPLTKSGTSWLTISMLPVSLQKKAEEEFEQMWRIHPDNKGKVVMKTGECISERWHKSYLKTPKRDPNCPTSYMFSGYDESTNNDALPALFQPYLDHVNSASFEDDMPRVSKHQFNQVVANWYDKNTDFIARHSDCEIGMVPNATIPMVTFAKQQTPNQSKPRRFVVHFKQKKCHDSIYSKVTVLLRHCSVVTMGGKTQQNFRHGIPREIEDCVDKRIGLSFRKFLSLNTEIAKGNADDTTTAIATVTKS